MARGPVTVNPAVNPSVSPNIQTGLPNQSLPLNTQAPTIKPQIAQPASTGALPVAGQSIGAPGQQAESPLVPGEPPKGDLPGYAVAPGLHAPGVARPQLPPFITPANPMPGGPYQQTTPGKVGLLHSFKPNRFE